MNYKDRTEEIFTRAEKYKKSKRKKLLCIASGVIAVAVAFSCVLFVPYPEQKTDLSAYRTSKYYALMQKIETVTRRKNIYKNNWEKWTDGLYKRDFAGSDSNTEMEGRQQYVETTDNQTEGVVEGDLLKRGDRYAYYFSADGALKIYSVAGAASVQEGEYVLNLPDEEFVCASWQNAEIYLNETCTCVTVVAEGYGEDKVCRTAIIPLDVSSVDNVKQGEARYVTGGYVSSRSVDGVITVVTDFRMYAPDFSEEKTFIPASGSAHGLTNFKPEEIISPATLSLSSYTVVCNYEDGEITSRLAFLSYNTEIYVSAENLYLVHPFTEEKNGKFHNVVEIARTSYRDGVEYKGSVTLDGSVKNQYSMDEKEGILRVVTTLSQPQTAALYCVDIDTFIVTAKLEAFAPEGESVQSVRFDGDKVYVCTAVVRTMTDPVFVIDLSDRNNIGLKDTGEIKGYSTSLRKFYGDTLLGIGYGESRALKVEIYKETANALTPTVSFSDESYFEFSQEYKSYFIDAERGLVGIPVCGVGGYGYILLRYDGETLQKTNEIIYTDAINYSDFKRELKETRAFLANGYLYVFTRNAFTPISLTVTSETEENVA